jgi:hypothetical protein
MYKLAQAAGFDPAALGLPPMADPNAAMMGGPAPAGPAMAPMPVQPPMPEPAQPIVIQNPNPAEQNQLDASMAVNQNLSEAVNNLIQINQSQGEMDPSNISDDAAAAVVASGALDGINPDDIDALVGTPPAPESTAATL